MLHRWLADLLVVAHGAFVLFVIFGALAVARWPRLAWLHLPAVAWAVLLEANAWICPLTPWEQALRRAAGEAGYPGGFVDHYLLPLLYPEGLEPSGQVVLAGAVLAVNLLLYAWMLHRRRRLRRAKA